MSDFLLREAFYTWSKGKPSIYWRDFISSLALGSQDELEEVAGDLYWNYLLYNWIKDESLRWMDDF